MGRDISFEKRPRMDSNLTSVGLASKQLKTLRHRVFLLWLLGILPGKPDLNPLIGSTKEIAMKKTMLAFAAAGLLALPGAAAAQQEGSRGWWGGWGDHNTEGLCPQPRRTPEKITEEQARNLAQAYGDKNLPGYKVVRPAGYGGGYETTCYQITNNGAHQLLNSVEYSIDLTTTTGDRRNVRVDQYGNVVPFGGPFGLAGAQGRDGSVGVQGAAGPAGQMGAQGPAGPMGPQGMAGSIKHWASFRNFLFDTDKSDIRSNEMSKVNDIAVYMRENSAARVGIDGHADPRGSDQYNQGLSERRVNAIRNALAGAGVAGDRIHTGAFGETQVKCTEASESCWQRDRRVEVLIGTDTASR
jgi:outer membrane protein OmpA-like peptidoglycan-associated protein